MEAKKTAYAKLEESKDEEVKRARREMYMVVRKEAKLVVTTAKTTTFNFHGVCVFMAFVNTLRIIEFCLKSLCYYI